MRIVSEQRSVPSKITVYGGDPGTVELLENGDNALTETNDVVALER